MPRILSYTASAEDDGRPVRDIIYGVFHLVAHDVARAKYRTAGGIEVNGETSLVCRKLRPGDVLTVRLDNELPGKTVPADGPVEILYEDEDLICLNKPSGIVVHPSHGHFGDTLGNYLAAYYLRCGDPHEIRTVGRLDKDTSGVIAFGKSRTACALLAGQCGIPAAEKEYLALASGVFRETEGVIEAPISREYEEKIRRVVRDDGAYAVTGYRVLRQYDDCALLRVKIETGRTHQIRVHMAYRGHALLGDPIYGDDEKESTADERMPSCSRAMLHAWKLYFKEPFGQEYRTVTAPIPDDMRRMLRWLAARSSHCKEL